MAYDNYYHFMLNQKSDRFPNSARGHVGGVAKEDGAVVLA